MENTEALSWVARLDSVELSEAIESTGRMANVLYTQGADTSVVDAKLDELEAEFYRRAEIS